MSAVIAGLLAVIERERQKAHEGIDADFDLARKRLEYGGTAEEVGQVTSPRLPNGVHVKPQFRPITKNAARDTERALERLNPIASASRKRGPGEAYILASLTDEQRQSARMSAVNSDPRLTPIQRSIILSSIKVDGSSPVKQAQLAKELKTSTDYVSKNLRRGLENLGFKVKKRRRAR